MRRFLPSVLLLSGFLLVGAVACEKASPEVSKKRVVEVKKTTKAVPKVVKPVSDGDVAATRLPMRGRLVAVGDVHGDLNALRQSLKIARVIDGQDHWSGGAMTLVQTGDLLDRGDDERAIIDFLERLEREAAAEGGRLVRLNGNHEIMNVAGDFRYVTPGGFKDFVSVEGLDLKQEALQRLPAATRPRAAAFAPGGPYAKRLARYNVAVVVGDTAFAHGGILPRHVKYGLERINQETREWMLGTRSTPPNGVTGPMSVVWTRLFSQDETAEGCAVLDEMLGALSAKRLVVGHTVQIGGVTSACDGKVWRIDVGMAAHYGGKPSALEIVGDRVTILKEAQKE